MESKEMTLTLDFDFNMLNRQKKALLKHLEGSPQSMLWGIIHMIDDIQDEAEKQGLWEFPDDTGNDLKTKKKTTVRKTVKKKKI